MPANNHDAPVCLVTGGTSGIGEATVRLFHSHGYCVATCGRDPQRLARLRERLSGDPQPHLVEQVDLADLTATRDFAEQAISQFGHVDVLVNNAATAPLAPFGEIGADTFEQTLSINIRVTFYLTQRIWQQMIQQGGGVIVNISSLAAIDPFPGFSIYGASKAWLDLMTLALASEGEEHGIRVYSIRAGAVETPLLRGLFPDFPPEQCVTAEQVAEQVWRCAAGENPPSPGQPIVVASQS